MKAPLHKKLAVFEKELFSTNKHLDEMKGKVVIRGEEEKIYEAKLVEKLEEKLAASRQELQSLLEIIRIGDEGFTRTESEHHQAEEELVSLDAEAKNTLEIMNELVLDVSQQEVIQKSLKDIIEMHVEGLEIDKENIIKHKLLVIQKDIENDDLLFNLESLKNCTKKAEIERKKVNEEILESEGSQNEKNENYDVLVANEIEWKSLTTLLNGQLGEKARLIENLNDQVSSFTLRLSTLESSYDEKVEQEEIVKESLVIIRDSSENQAEADGWDIDESLSAEKSGNIEQLRSDIERAAVEKQAMESEMEILEHKTKVVENELQCSNSLIESLHNEKTDAEDNCAAVECKIEVFTELFNKKETELQKQLGKQTALLGETSVDAVSEVEKLEKAGSELKEANNQLEITKTKLQHYDGEMKSKVAEKEQEAHNSWIASKQADRKLLELEEEFSLLKDRMLAIKEDNKPCGIPTLPSLPGMPANLSSLPPLPGIPCNLPSLPGMPSDLPLLPGTPYNLPSLPGMLTMPSLPAIPNELPSLFGMPSNFPSLSTIPGYLPSLPGMASPTSSGLLSMFSVPSPSGISTTTPTNPSVFKLPYPRNLPQSHLPPVHPNLSLPGTPNQLEMPPIPGVPGGDGQAYHTRAGSGKTDNKYDDYGVTPSLCSRFAVVGTRGERHKMLYLMVDKDFSQY